MRAGCFTLEADLKSEELCMFESESDRQKIEEEKQDERIRRAAAPELPSVEETTPIKIVSAGNAGAVHGEGGGIVKPNRDHN